MLDYNESKKPKEPKLSEFAKQVNAYIDNALTVCHQSEPQRHYLGASRIGVSCKRAIQYEYTHTPKDVGFSGKTLRIFQIGHEFEYLAIKWLRQAGFILHTEQENGKQFGFSAANGKFAGHIDGVIYYAPSELNMSYPALWEAKSLKDSSWQKTVKQGLSKSKPVYAAQIAIYQAYMEATIPGISQHPCLFTAVNKDTAEIYHELVPFNAALAQEMSDKAVQIIEATEHQELLPKASNDPDFYECKYCAWKDRCWGENDNHFSLGSKDTTPSQPF